MSWGTGRWSIVGVLAILLCPLGCGTDEHGTEEGGAVDASVQPDGAPGADASSTETGADSASKDVATDVGSDDAAQGWAAVDQLITQSFEDGTIKGKFVWFEVFDQKGNKLHSVGAGDVPKPGAVLSVASGSKWVSSTVILSLVQEGKLSLEDTTGKVLGWSEPDLGRITLRSLLSFTSGLAPNACTYDPSVSLQACAEEIHNRGLESGATVGKTFHYGSQHMAVAGAMVEKVTGKSWKSLFEERVAKPAGMTDSPLYYTLPKKRRGGDNPLVAGGLVISIRDYERFLGALQGIGGTALLSTSMFSEQHAEQWPADVTVKDTPNLGIHYGLGCWRECATPDVPERCDADLMVHSIGAYGFAPFIDLAHGFYGVLAAEGELGASKGSLSVLKKVRPLVVAVLRH